MEQEPSKPGCLGLNTAISASVAVGPSLPAKVFAIPELLENILLHVSKVTDLFVLRRVNTVFRDTMKVAKALRQRMLLDKSAGQLSAHWDDLDQILGSLTRYWKPKFAIKIRRRRNPFGYTWTLEFDRLSYGPWKYSRRHWERERMFSTAHMRKAHQILKGSWHEISFQVPEGCLAVEAHAIAGSRESSWEFHSFVLNRGTLSLGQVLDKINVSLDIESCFVV